MPADCAPCPGQTKPIFGGGGVEDRMDGFVFLRETAKTLDQRGPALRHESRAMRQGGSPSRGGPADIADVGGRIRLELVRHERSPSAAGPPDFAPRAAEQPRASTVPRGLARGAGAARASSSTTCAFVPEMPSAVTPATPGFSPSGKAMVSPGTDQRRFPRGEQRIWLGPMEARRNAAMMENEGGS